MRENSQPVFQPENRTPVEPVLVPESEPELINEPLLSIDSTEALKATDLELRNQTKAIINHIMAVASEPGQPAEVLESLYNGFSSFANWLIELYGNDYVRHGTFLFHSIIGSTLMPGRYVFDIPGLTDPNIDKGATQPAKYATSSHFTRLDTPHDEIRRYLAAVTRELPHLRTGEDFRFIAAQVLTPGLKDLLERRRTFEGDPDRSYPVPYDLFYAVRRYGLLPDPL